MSKQIRFVLTTLIASIALFAGLLQPSASSSDSRPSSAPVQQSPATSAAARNSALIAATEAVLKETSEIRQLSILRPVQSSTQSRAEIEGMVVKNLDEDTTPAEMHADEVTLKKLGLAPADFQFRALMIRVLTEQVAGYYDPKTHEFHLADWIDLDGQKPIMAHELTHALQDQHFNLGRFEHWPKGDSDAELAAHALIEGDATLSMALYVANNPLRWIAFLKSLGTTGTPSVELDKAPRALRETLLFPYQEGTVWTRSLYKNGGWDRVSNAFTELPQSTEQILHPEKYFAHEGPIKVTLPDVTSVLSGQGSVVGAQRSVRREDLSLVTRHSSPVAGWRRLDYDIEGEWGLYLILDQFLKSSAESHRAAAGWGGDRFEIYEGPQGEACIVSLSAWDTENDAREFFDAYVKRTELRYPNAERLPSFDATTPNSELKTPNVFAWRTSESLVLIELRANRVLIVEGLPQGVDAKQFLKTLWQ